MTNTTATGGALVPSSTTYESDDPLSDLVSDVVAAILALDRNSVRPRFQLDASPQMPGPRFDWVAVGTSSVTEASLRGMTQHVPDGDGSDVVATPERHDMLLSFYGPRCISLARGLRDGLKVEPNRYALRAAGLAYCGSGPIVQLGEQINQSWYRRSDMSVRFDGLVLREYPVLNLLSVQGSFVTVHSRLDQSAESRSHGFQVEV